jgi:hypothetical protein
MDSASVLRFQEEVRPYLKMLREASRTIIDQDVSLHPIFVFHTDDLELGVEVANADNVSGNWSVNASTLEEFVAKRLIEDAKIDTFKETFKDPEEYFCLFVVAADQSAQFIFVPQELTGAN